MLLYPHSCEYVLGQKQNFWCSGQWPLNVFDAVDCLNLAVTLKPLGCGYSFLI